LLCLAWNSVRPGQSGEWSWFAPRRQTCGAARWVGDSLMHHKATKKQENRSVKAKIVQKSHNHGPIFMLLCALCGFVVEILFQAATRHGTSSLRTVFCVSTGNVWFADEIKRSYGVGCWIAEVSSRIVRCLPMTWATSLNSVGPKGSNQSDTEFQGVCAELRGANSWLDPIRTIHIEIASIHARHGIIKVSTVRVTPRKHRVRLIILLPAA
jgi:hypothetical protein